jgi:hypothetical protein
MIGSAAQTVINNNFMIHQNIHHPENSTAVNTTVPLNTGLDLVACWFLISIVILIIIYLLINQIGDD